MGRHVPRKPEPVVRELVLDDEGNVVEDSGEVKEEPSKRAKRRKPPKTPPCPRRRRHNRPHRKMY